MLDIVFGPSSKLYNELYEEGLIDDEFDAGYVAEIDYSHSIIGGETADPERLYDRLVAGIKRAQAEGISQAEFSHYQRKAMGEFLKSFNSLEFVANSYPAYHFKNINFFDYLQVLQELTHDDVNQRLQEHLKLDYMARSVIWPKS